MPVLKYWFYFDRIHANHVPILSQHRMGSRNCFEKKFANQLLIWPKNGFKSFDRESGRSQTAAVALSPMTFTPTLSQLVSPVSVEENRGPVTDVCTIIVEALTHVRLFCIRDVTLHLIGAPLISSSPFTNSQPETDFSLNPFHSRDFILVPTENS